MKKTVLITGGAGFIGSHTADELARRGYTIRILDNLSPKIHFGRWPNYLKPDYEKIRGDVTNKADLEKSLVGADYVIHLAAQMDLLPQFSIFFNTNVTSTAAIYELIVEKNIPIKKVVVASSQFAYGEGRWFCPKDSEIFPGLRTPQQLEKKQWDPVCPKCGGKIKYLDNLETHQDPPNQYAISKYTEELIALKIGRNYNIPSVAMRYSIVHGPRQSLKNAYSGALRIFAMKLLKKEVPAIYEDGLMQRDFVSVYDVAKANADVLTNPRADYENFNVGSGTRYTVMDLALLIAKELDVSVNFKPSGFRLGDIRHAVSNISKLQALGWQPKDSEEGIVKVYLEWLKEEIKKQDYYSFLSEAESSLRKAGVVRS